MASRERIGQALAAFRGTAKAVQECHRGGQALQAEAQGELENLRVHEAQLRGIVSSMIK